MSTDSPSKSNVVLKKKKKNKAAAGVSRERRKMLSSKASDDEEELVVKVERLNCSLCHKNRSRAKVRYKGRDLYMCRRCVYESQAALDEFGTISRNPKLSTFDRWGFLIADRVEGASNDRAPAPLRPQGDLKKEQERAAKWQAMFDLGLESIPAAKLHDRCRKGIPDTARGAAWVQLTLGSYSADEKKRTEMHGCYARLLAEAQDSGMKESKKESESINEGEKEEGGEKKTEEGGEGEGEGEKQNVEEEGSVKESESEKKSEEKSEMLSPRSQAFRSHPKLAREHGQQILKDLPRTFPGHALFADKEGRGQRALRRVLESYAVRNPQLGYCQGMAMVVGVLLMYVDEADAFAMLCILCEDERRFGLTGVWEPGMPALASARERTEQLVAKMLPRLWSHFEAKDLMLGVVVDSWFLTWFLYSLPFDVVIRLWDLLLCHGQEFIYAIILSLLKIHESQLLSMNEEGIYELLRFAGGSGGPATAAASGSAAAASLNIDKLTSTACSYYKNMH